MLVESKSEIGKTKEKVKEKMEPLSFNYQIPIKEQGFMNGQFTIAGTAISSSVTSNNHKFLPEELKLSADTLNGVPLLVDHRNEVDAIKGRVIVSEFDDVNEKVNFKAQIEDESIKEMIKDGRLNSVSVGAIVKELEDDGDYFIPRGIVFKELSLVAVPADPRATFDIALKEAYKSSFTELKGGSDKVGDEEAKDEAKEEVEDEAKEEVKPEEAKEEAKEEEAKPEEEKEAVTEEKVKSIVKATLKEAEEAKPEEKKEESKPEEDSEESEEAEDEEVSEGYKIEQSAGTLRGGAFILVR